MLAPGVIIPYDGEHASIPPGFVRETSLDGKFPKGFGSSSVNSIGGSSTHTHTSPSHTHTMNNHTHSYTMNSNSSQSVEDGSESGTPNPSADNHHYHTGTTGSVTGGSLTGSATIGSGSNLPPFHELIFIRALKYASIPTGGLMFRNDTDEPGGFHFCDGENDTPNLVNKYIRGAVSEANAGGTGGSLTHTHTYNHSHASVSHGHATKDSGVNTHMQTTSGSSSGSGAADYHWHSVSFGNTSVSSNAVSGSFESGTVEPAHHTIRANKNTSGVNQLPTPGDIALWLGDEDNLPPGWVVCDGENDTPNLKDKFVKISTTPGTTGGSNTHSHSGVASHTHTATGTHTHSASVATNTHGHTPNGNGYSKSKQSHTHSMASFSSQTAVWASSTINTDEINSEPEYRAAVFVQMKYLAGTGASVIPMFM